MKHLLLLSLALTAKHHTVRADIVFDNEVIKTEEIFDIDYANTSDAWAYENDGANTTKYYCVFRSTWNKENHPAQYPQLARWGNQLIFSHTKEYAPFLKDRAAQLGLKKIATVRRKPMFVISRSTRESAHGRLFASAP
jgi:Spondin_N